MESGPPQRLITRQDVMRAVPIGPHKSIGRGYVRRFKILHILNIELMILRLSSKQLSCQPLGMEVYQAPTNM